MLFTTVDTGSQARLSGHRPIAVLFGTDGTIEPHDTFAMALDWLGALKAEIEDIQTSLAAFFE